MYQIYYNWYNTDICTGNKPKITDFITGYFLFLKIIFCSLSANIPVL